MTVITLYRSLDTQKIPIPQTFRTFSLSFENPRLSQSPTVRRRLYHRILINDVGRKTHALFPFTTGMRYLRAGGPFHLLIRVLPSLSYTSRGVAVPRPPAFPDCTSIWHRGGGVSIYDSDPIPGTNFICEQWALVGPPNFAVRKYGPMKIKRFRGCWVISEARPDGVN